MKRDKEMRRVESESREGNFFKSRNVPSIENFASYRDGLKIIFRLSRYKREESNNQTEQSVLLTSNGGRFASLLINLDESLLYDFRDIQWHRRYAAEIGVTAERRSKAHLKQEIYRAIRYCVTRNTLNVYRPLIDQSGEKNRGRTLSDNVFLRSSLVSVLNLGRYSLTSRGCACLRRVLHASMTSLSVSVNAGRPSTLLGRMITILISLF